MCFTSRTACLIFLVTIGLRAWAQSPNAADTSHPVLAAQAEQVPRVPGINSVLRGFNAGVTFSQVHDSSAGWYNIVTPAVSYMITPHYSADTSVSIYPYRLIQNPSLMPPPNQQLVANHGSVGDTLIGLHASFYPKRLQSWTTASFTIPTGSRSSGLGTGRVTYDISELMQRFFGQAGLLLDLGGGDSSTLFNHLVTRDDYSLGYLVHFRTGAVVYLPGGSHLESVAFEQLPLGHQKLFNTTTSTGTPESMSMAGNSASEDNGFTTYFAYPLTDHLTFSSYYNRSLRQHLDTASTGITYVMRGSPKRKGLSLIDRALREAAGATP